MVTTVLKLWIARGISLLLCTFYCFLLIPATTSAREPRQKGFTNNTCSRNDILASKIDVCAKPLMDIVEGKLEQWPKVADDIAHLCTQFTDAERCIRDNGRKCGQGLQKVIISTVANSIQRTRKRECSPSKYPGFLLLTKCLESNLHIPHQIIANATSRLTVVEKMRDVDRKTTGVCCSIYELEKEMTRSFKSVCPNEAVVLLRLYRSVLEDVLEVICRNVKCIKPFDGYQLPLIKPGIDTTLGIITFLMRIVFSLGD